MVGAGLLAYRSVLVQLTNAVAVMGRERNGALIAAALETCNINFEVSLFFDTGTLAGRRHCNNCMRAYKNSGRLELLRMGPRFPELAV